MIQSNPLHLISNIRDFHSLRAPSFIFGDHFIVILALSVSYVIVGQYLPGKVVIAGDLDDYSCENNEDSQPLQGY